MAHIVLDCPVCHAQQMTMAVLHRALTRDELGIAFAQCGRCTYPITAIVSKGPRFKLGRMLDWVAATGDVIAETGVHIADLVPEKREPRAPKHVPSDTARVYIQAQSARQRKELDTAGMAFRKVLEIGLKEYDPSLDGTLYKRIDALADTHVITQAMKEWAHQIRLLGNGIAHEPNEPSEQEVEAIAYFTETLLQYLFTMPEEVRLRKEATSEE